MPQHHGRAADAAELMRERHERLIRQMAEFENLRARVREAERACGLNKGCEKPPLTERSPSSNVEVCDPFHT